MTTMNRTTNWDAAQQKALDWIFTHNHEVLSTMNSLAREIGQKKVDAMIPYVASQWRATYQGDELSLGRGHIEHEREGIRDLIALGQDSGPLLDRFMRHTAQPQEVWDALRLTITVVESGDRQQVSANYPRVMSMEWTPPQRRVDGDVLFHDASSTGQEVGRLLMERFPNDNSLIAQIESLPIKQADVLKKGFHQRLLMAIGSRHESALAIARQLAEHGTTDSGGRFPESPGVLLSWMGQQPTELLRSDKRLMATLSRWAIGGRDHQGDPLPGELREDACALLGRLAQSS